MKKLCRENDSLPAPVTHPVRRNYSSQIIIKKTFHATSAVSLFIGALNTP